MQSVQITLVGTEVIPMRFVMTLPMLSILSVPTTFWMLVSVSGMHKVLLEVLQKGKVSMGHHRSEHFITHSFKQKT